MALWKHDSSRGRRGEKNGRVSAKEISADAAIAAVWTGWNCCIERRTNNGTEDFPWWNTSFHFAADWLWREFSQIQQSVTARHGPVTQGSGISWTGSTVQEWKNPADFWVITIFKKGLDILNILYGLFIRWIHRIRPIISNWFRQELPTKQHSVTSWLKNSCTCPHKSYTL